MGWINGVAVFRCRNSIVTSVVLAKRAEIEAGVDGFLAYDPKLIPSLHQVSQLTEYTYLQQSMAS